MKLKILRKLPAALWITTFSGGPDFHCGRAGAELEWRTANDEGRGPIKRLDE